MLPYEIPISYNGGTKIICNVVLSVYWCQYTPYNQIFSLNILIKSILDYSMQSIRKYCYLSTTSGVTTGYSFTAGWPQLAKLKSVAKLLG